MSEHVSLAPSRCGELKTKRPVGIQEVNRGSGFMVLSFGFPTAVSEVAPGHPSLGKALMEATRTSYSSFL